jgi:hypothetical protein
MLLKSSSPLPAYNAGVVGSCKFVFVPRIDTRAKIWNRIMYEMLMVNENRGGVGVG